MSSFNIKLAGRKLNSYSNGNRMLIESINNQIQNDIIGWGETNPNWIGYGSLRKSNGFRQNSLYLNVDYGGRLKKTGTTIESCSRAAALYCGDGTGKCSEYCAGNPCQNGGVCMDGTNNYICKCINGYSGTNCDLDPCDSTNCFENRCTIISISPYYQCDIASITSVGLSASTSIVPKSADGGRCTTSYPFYMEDNDGRHCFTTQAFADGATNPGCSSWCCRPGKICSCGGTSSSDPSTFTGNICQNLASDSVTFVINTAAVGGDITLTPTATGILFNPATVIIASDAMTSASFTMMAEGGTVPGATRIHVKLSGSATNIVSSSLTVETNTVIVTSS